MKASLKSRGSILSHVTSGTWEEDADIEDPHQAEEKRKTPRVLFHARDCVLKYSLATKSKAHSEQFCGHSGGPVHACPSPMGEPNLICASSQWVFCAGTLVHPPARVLSDHWDCIRCVPTASRSCTSVLC